MLKTFLKEPQNHVANIIPQFSSCCRSIFDYLTTEPRRQKNGKQQPTPIEKLGTSPSSAAVNVNPSPSADPNNNNNNNGDDEHHVHTEIGDIVWISRVHPPVHSIQPKLFSVVCMTLMVILFVNYAQRIVVEAVDQAVRAHPAIQLRPN